MQAFIFAAGFGKRLRPLTDKTPKPLIPIGNGECALGRILSVLSDLNFTKIVVNTHHLADQIREYCSKKYPNVVISHEDKILETGGAFVKALTHFDQKQPVLAINGDIYKEDLNKSIKDLYEAYDSEKMDFLLGLVDKNDVIGPRPKGDYFMDEKGLLVHREEKGSADYPFSGIRILNPKIYEAALVKPYSMKEDFDKSENRKRLHGILLKKKWCDIGTHEALDCFKNGHTRIEPVAEPF